MSLKATLTELKETYRPRLPASDRKRRKLAGVRTVLPKNQPSLVSMFSNMQQKNAFTEEMTNARTKIPERAKKVSKAVIGNSSNIQATQPVVAEAFASDKLSDVRLKQPDNPVGTNIEADDTQTDCAIYLIHATACDELVDDVGCAEGKPRGASV